MMHSPTFTAADVARAIEGVIASGKHPVAARICPRTGAIEIQLGKSLAERLSAFRFEDEMRRWASDYDVELARY